MVKRKKNKPQIVTYIIIAFLSFLFIYPFWHTAVVSFSSKAYAMQPGFKFWPKEISLAAYEYVFQSNRLLIGYKNTLIRTIVGTFLTLAFTFPISYSLSHKNIPGKSAIEIFLIFTMFFSGGTVPTYLNIKELGLLDTRWVMILPAIASAWNYIVMRNFITGLGTEMEEAARIDGASAVQIMLRIVLPLSKASLAVIGLWCAVWHWNAWYDVMVYANKRELQVVQQVIRSLASEGNQLTAIGVDAGNLARMTPDTIKSATIVIGTVPILAAYPFIQKYLVKGTMIGAVKG